MVEKTQARETVIELIWFVSTVYTKKNFLKVCPCIELGSLLAHFQSSPGKKVLGPLVNYFKLSCVWPNWEWCVTLASKMQRVSILNPERGCKLRNANHFANKDRFLFPAKHWLCLCCFLHSIDWACGYIYGWSHCKSMQTLVESSCGKDICNMAQPFMKSPKDNTIRP